MTFGTVLGYMSIASRVYRAALRAVEHVEGACFSPWATAFDPGALGPLPSHVHVEPWVDQDRVFPEADLVVCHGGSGTAFGALAAGVPLVTVPVFAGQFENSRRIGVRGESNRRNCDPLCRRSPTAHPMRSRPPSSPSWETRPIAGTLVYWLWRWPRPLPPGRFSPGCSPARSRDAGDLAGGV